MARNQKNFEIPDKLQAEWDRFMQARGTIDKYAGPVALHIATKLNSSEWAKAVDAYNSWLGSRVENNGEGARGAILDSPKLQKRKSA